MAIVEPSFEKLWEEVKSEFPRAKIVRKDKSLFMKIIFSFLFFTGIDYINNFITTIGCTVYVPPSWDNGDYSDYSKYAVIRHERTHMRQFRSWPFGRYFWWINPVLMGFCYIFVLPVFWTTRSYFEKEGYIQNMLVSYERTGTIDLNYWMVKLEPVFCGPKYCWMDTKKSFRKWITSTVAKIQSGEIK